MIDVTTRALVKIKEGLEGKGDDPSIRVSVESLDCSGPLWSLSLDDPGEEDEQCFVEGVRFLISASLQRDYGQLHMDYEEGGWRPGFSITPERRPTLSCTRCGCKSSSARQD